MHVQGADSLVAWCNCLTLRLIASSYLCSNPSSLNEKDNVIVNGKCKVRLTCVKKKDAEIWEGARESVSKARKKKREPQTSAS